MKSTTHKITITNPCDEDWNKMTPVNQGRFCSSCKTEVVDFTKMSSTEVIDYFQKNKNSISCGRFLKTQVDIIQIPFDPIVFSDKTVFWQRFLFIILFCFGQELFNIEIVFAQELPKDTLALIPLVETPQLDSSTLVIEPPIDSNNVKVDSLNIIDIKTYTLLYPTLVTTEYILGSTIISGWCTIEQKKRKCI